MKPAVALALAGILTVANDSSPARRRDATVVLSGGCYWTMEAVFEHVRGVTNVVSGMAGREAGPASYAWNPTGSIGPAEAVEVTFDPAEVSLEDLLQVVFSVAHDPSQVDRQGPDAGKRYRSVVWTADDEQRKATADYVRRLEAERARPRKVATQIARLDRFEPVVESEQDFARRHPDHPYVVAWDRPRLEAFRRTLPTLYRERPISSSRETVGATRSVVSPWREHRRTVALRH